MQEDTNPRYFVVRLPGAFTTYGDEAGYQTVVLARTANEAANSLKCELGANVKSLLIKAENIFLI